MTDLVQRLRDARDLKTDERVRESLCGEAAAEIERLRGRCENYQASRDYAIHLLAVALRKADEGSAVEYYAKCAAERIAALEALAVAAMESKP